jgi:glycosyltransferase involved in cell wall biosynthesis
VSGPSPATDSAGATPHVGVDLVLVTQFFPPETGAGARRAGALAAALASRFRLRVVTLEPGYPDPALYTRDAWQALDRDSGLAIERGPAFRPHDTSLVRRALREIRVSFALVSAARRHRPRVLVVSTPSMFLAPLGWLAARTSGAKFAWDLRDLTWRYAKESGPVGGATRPLLDGLEGFMLWLLRRADLVISATAGLTDVIREQGVPERSLVTVTNGVSKAFLDRFAGETPPTGNARPRVTYVGLMGYNHGIGILLDVAKAMPEADVVLVGDGPERPAIEERLRGERIANVTLHGYVTDAAELARLYRESDVLVNHTRGTPTLDRIVYPAKTFEYFATGRPVVYAGAGYAADLFRDRDLATVVPPGDAGAFVRGLRETLADPARSAARAARARQFVETGYCREEQMARLAGEIATRFGGASRRPRVAVVTTVHRWGDPRVFERETAAWLEWGCEVHVFVPMTGEPAPRSWSGNPALHVHPLPEPRGRQQRMRLAFGIAGTIRREGAFDLVQFHDPELIPAMASLALRWNRTYFLYDIHEDLPLEVKSKAWIPSVLRPAVVVAVSAMWRASAMLFEGFAPATEAISRRWPAARTRIVHNYPKALFEPPPGEDVAMDPNRLLFVGRLTEVRGIRGMLEHVRAARARFPALVLDLVGPLVDSTLAPDVERAVAEGWCRHTPWLAPELLADRCRGAAVGLVPYLPIPDHLEALPTKIFEYMAMGIPILASDFPLWRDLIEASGAGRVADPAAPAFGATLEAMLADPAGLARHAERGREAYRGGYRWETERENLRWHLERARLAMSGAAS